MKNKHLNIILITILSCDLTNLKGMDRGWGVTLLYNMYLRPILNPISTEAEIRIEEIKTINFFNTMLKKKLQKNKNFLNDIDENLKIYQEIAFLNISPEKKDLLTLFVKM